MISSLLISINSTLCSSQIRASSQLNLLRKHTELQIKMFRCYKYYNKLWQGMTSVLLLPLSDMPATCTGVKLRNVHNRNCVAWYLCVLTSSLDIYYKCKISISIFSLLVADTDLHIDKSLSRSQMEHKDWAQKWDQVRSLQSDEILSRQCHSATGPHTTSDMPCNIFAVCKYSATFSPTSWLA